MKILAVDIGGTTSRLAVVNIENLKSLEICEPFIFETDQVSINSLNDWFRYFKENAPGFLTDDSNYDAIVLAVAGAVSGQAARLPNVSWDIDLRGQAVEKELLLINDFLAQAHGFMVQSCIEDLVDIRNYHLKRSHPIAIVGAGTGLGHCLLFPSRAKTEFHPVYQAIASEHGHVAFPFIGSSEKELELFLLEKSNSQYITYDDVVSGRGITQIHEFLSGELVKPEIAIQRDTGNQETINLFSRFFARACRNYCLATGSFKKLILSGGIAAKNPHVVSSNSFLTEFSASEDYKDLLDQVSIFLNKDETMGLKGAAVHAFLQRNRCHGRWCR